jgi:hypothetical protein
MGTTCHFTSYYDIITEETAVTRLQHSKQLISIAVAHETEEQCYLCSLHGHKMVHGTISVSTHINIYGYYLKNVLISYILNDVQGIKTM